MHIPMSRGARRWRGLEPVGNRLRQVPQLLRLGEDIQLGHEVARKKVSDLCSRRSLWRRSIRIDCCNHESLSNANVPAYSKCRGTNGGYNGC